MPMTLRVGIIDSNETTLGHDYDFQRWARWATGGDSGVLFSDLTTKPEFDIDQVTGDLDAGVCLVKVTRTGSTPIANQEFWIVVQLDATETVAITNGYKIFIEIDDTLLQDPTQIVDTAPSTDFAQGKNIAYLRSQASYPTHNNYIKLWEIDGGGTFTDMREDTKMIGDFVDMSNMTQNIITTGDVTSNTVNATTVDATNIELDGDDLGDTINDIETNGAPSPHLTNVDYYVGEAVSEGDSLFLEEEVEQADASTAQNIGDVSGNTRIGIPIFGSGVAGTTLKLNLAVITSPSVNLAIRIETDSSGEPSGALADPNATATVTPGSLTGSLADTTVTLAGSVTLSVGVKYHIVLFQGTYGAETVNGTNYYQVGCYTNDTTTRGLRTYNGSVYSSVVTTKWAYVDSDLVIDKLISLTDANFLYKIPSNPWFAKDNYAIGGKARYDFKGISKHNTGLTYNRIYFLSDTPGAISLTEGTNTKPVGIAKDTDELEIWDNQPRFTRTTARSPSGIFNSVQYGTSVYVKRRCIMDMSISSISGSNANNHGWQYSFDNSTWVTGYSRTTGTASAVNRDYEFPAGVWVRTFQGGTGSPAADVPVTLRRQNDV